MPARMSWHAVGAVCDHTSRGAAMAKKGARRCPNAPKADGCNTVRELAYRKLVETRITFPRVGHAI